MTEDEMRKLIDGDIVRHRGSGEPYIVTGNFGQTVTAVRQAHITNPDEWEVVVKSQAVRVEAG